jgi:hypothetical protein
MLFLNPRLAFLDYGQQLWVEVNLIGLRCVKFCTYVDIYNYLIRQKIERLWNLKSKFIHYNFHLLLNFFTLNSCFHVASSKKRAGFQHNPVCLVSCNKDVWRLGLGFLICFIRPSLKLPSVAQITFTRLWSVYII